VPLVEYRNMSENTSIQRKMPNPKRITSIEHWLKEARKYIPEMPQVAMAQGIYDWYVLHHDFDMVWVKFELRSNQDEKAQVLIHRPTPFLGTQI
jgi:hypothetical protein